MFNISNKKTTRTTSIILDIQQYTYIDIIYI